LSLGAVFVDEAACPGGGAGRFAPPPRALFWRGWGEFLSPPLDLPRLPAVLVHPRVALPTRDVFARLAAPRHEGGRADTPAVIPYDPLSYVLGRSNDLEGAAIALQPVVAYVLAGLRELGGCRLAP